MLPSLQEGCPGCPTEHHPISPPKSRINIDQLKETCTPNTNLPMPGGSNYLGHFKKHMKTSSSAQPSSPSRLARFAPRSGRPKDSTTSVGAPLFRRNKTRGFNMCQQRFLRNRRFDSPIIRYPPLSKIRPVQVPGYFRSLFGHISGHWLPLLEVLIGVSSLTQTSTSWFWGSRSGSSTVVSHISG